MDYGANRQKGDADAASWLPANKAYRCAYVARQIAVKAKYGVWVTPAEKSAMSNVLATCPNEPLPTGSAVVPAPVPTNQPAPAPSTPPTSGPTRYATCTDAKAAGVTPILRDQNPALYAANPHLDRDKDGRACTS